MKKKNIVSIEDRIPKLKQERKKKANRRLIFYLSIFFILISIIVYLQSPLSNIKEITITGNSFVSDKKIIEQSNLTENTNIWTINKSDIKQMIGENPVIKSVEITRKLPRNIEIQLTEYKRVAYLKKNNDLLPVLGNGTTLSAVQKPKGDAPIMLEFTDETYLLRMTEELKLLPTSILNLISEIYWKPTDENQSKILLYMNDGFLVDGTIRNFAEKMQVYPSILSQLDPGSKGTIHIGVGAYFEEFEKEINEKETE